MTTLFTQAELVTYLQQPVSTDAYDLAHELTEDAIMGEAAGRLADPPQHGVKAVAIAVAARSLTNPAGVRSESAGSVAVTYRDMQAGGVELTADERRRLRRAVGLISGAGSINIAPDEREPRDAFRCST
ncbi:hypothetical protein [Kitasatospora fiedleri]|uniref:hypothetical protein n=1 Tax=Kitasatospora fiedleri TaxID=2991545 RepID=UPI00249C9893|nr:hypothetical protein [Kitasatospora fiedleri]